MRTRVGQRGRGFSLVEAALAVVLVGLMFGAAVSAQAGALRDRRTLLEMRRGAALAGELMAEITARRYTDGGAFGRAAGASMTDRSTWKDVDDYDGLDQSPPLDRAGAAVPGASGWRWRAAVAYATPPALAAGNAPPGGVVTGLLSTLGTTVGTAVGAVADTPAVAATDTGLKRITVTVTSPTGKSFALTAYRCSKGLVDRRATLDAGFRTFAAVGLSVGTQGTSVEVGAPMRNTPATP